MSPMMSQSDTSLDPTPPGGPSGVAVDAGRIFVYVSGYAATVRVYRLDLSTGVLEATALTSDGGNNPSYLAFHSDRRFLYAVNEAGADSQILAFAIDGATGGLTRLAGNGGQASTSPGEGPPHLSVHPSGKWIHVAHFGSGHTTVHAVGPDGGVGAAIASYRTADAEAHQAKQDPTGNFLFVPCRGPNYVAQYRIDHARGALVANSPARVWAPSPGTGPRHLDFHPSGRWAYLLGELNGHVISYQYDGSSGLLSDPQETTVGDGETAAAHILVHPNGRFLFTSLRTRNEIATLAVDPESGRLTVIARQATMIAGPRDFTIDPSGRYLLVANSAAATVVSFRIAADGRLTVCSRTSTVGIPRPAFVGTLVLPG